MRVDLVAIHLVGVVDLVAIDLDLGKGSLSHKLKVRLVAPLGFKEVLFGYLGLFIDSRVTVTLLSMVYSPTRLYSLPCNFFSLVYLTTKKEDYFACIVLGACLGLGTKL